MWDKGTNVERACQESFEIYCDSLFKDKIWGRGTGKKKISVINSTQEEPSGVYIRITKLGGREPWAMCDVFNGVITPFHEHKLTFLIDVRASETDQRTPDNKSPSSLTVKNPKTNVSVEMENTWEITDNICNALRQTVEMHEWKMLLSSMGIHNPQLTDERESMQGTEYVNPMKLVFNTYILI